MIINDFNIFCAVFPAKNYSPLFVDTNTVITDKITFQIFKTISRGRAQIIQTMRGVENIQLA